MNDSLYLPRPYRRNQNNEPFVDSSADFIYQPHVYELAARCAAAGKVSRVIDLGCGSGRKLSAMPPGLQISVFDLNPDEDALRASLPGFTLDVHRCNLDESFPELLKEDLSNAIIICSDVIEHLRRPLQFLEKLGQLAKYCRFMFLSTPARDRARGAGDLGPPGNLAHCQEWTLSEFLLLAQSAGLNLPLHGYTWNTDYHGWKSTILAIGGKDALPESDIISVAPCAIIKSFNDADFILQCIRHHRRQGLNVHVIDNWSTDNTFDISLGESESDPGVTVERFPSAPSEVYNWEALLRRTVSFAEERGVGWYLHVDSDEFRESPWMNVNLAKAIAHLDSLGYNAIDFTVLDFRYLVGEALGDRPWESMRFFEFGRRPGHFKQVKAWKFVGQTVDLWSSGGHDALFQDRRIFPLKFLLRHYPLRGVDHAFRKIFQERLPRSELERSTRGWHTQYVGVSDERLNGWRRHELIAWHSVSFNTEYLMERISGIGLLD